MSRTTSAGSRLAVAGLALAIYFPSLGNPLYRDDLHTLWFSGAALAGAGWKDLLLSPGYYSMVGFGSYHPIPTLIQALCRAWLPAPEFWMRLLSAATHAGVALLVAEGALLLTASEGAAAAAGLLFAVHPAHAQAVLGIGWYGEVLAAFFALASFYAFMRSAEGEGWAWASVAAFFLAIFSKEHPLILPFLLLAAPAPAGQGAPGGLGSQWRSLSYRTKRILLIGWAAAWVSYAWVVIFQLRFPEAAALLSSAPAQAGAGSWARLAFALQLLFFPWGLSPSHSVPSAWVLARDGAAAFILLAPVFWLVRKRGWGAAGGFAFLWMLAALWAPLLPLAGGASQNKFANNFFSERYLYLASAGWAWLMGAALLAAVRQITLRPRLSALRWAPAIFLGGALLGGSLGVLWQDWLWGDSVLLWKDTAEKAPDSLEARLGLAERYLDSGSYHKAEEILRSVLASDRAGRLERAGAYTGLASCSAELKDFASAEKYAKLAAAGDPNNEMNWSLLGGLYLRNGDEKNAEAALQKSIKLRPVQTQAYYQLALLHEERGETGQAAALFELIVKLDPGYADAGARLASLRLRSGTVKGLSASIGRK